MDLRDIAILNMKRDDYRRIISGISKYNAINLMQNAKKWNIIKHKQFISTYKNW